MTYMKIKRNPPTFRPRSVSSLIFCFATFIVYIVLHHLKSNIDHKISHLYFTRTGEKPISLTQQQTRPKSKVKKSY
jgi:hypothetical protein